MRKTIVFILFLCCTCLPSAFAQFETNNNDGNGMRGMSGSGLDRHSGDSTGTHQEVPKGLKVWTVDRLFGDRIEAEPDTAQHLFMNTIFTNGLYGEYNNLGNLGSPRINRIAIDRFSGDDFIFAQPYDFFITQPDEFHFTNTLSPITNLSYNTCGSGNYGEDHLKALFATNAGKRLGVGMKFDYVYGKGYYQNSNTSHFNYSIYGSYIGDRYNAHLLVSLNHQKVHENGGITNDEFIKHPESISDNFSEEEIPTVLSRHWNRNDNENIFFSHRYSFGYNRKVPMTEEEKEAKKFALKSKAENDAKRAKALARKEKGDDWDEEEYDKEVAAAKKAAEAEQKDAPEDSTLWLKNEYVPVTSIVHTADFRNYKRIYQAYETPSNYFAKQYFDKLDDGSYQNDSIYDLTKHYHLKNTVALAMLEGFNKWVPMGLKLFASHEFRYYTLPDENAVQKAWVEHNLSVGGQLQKTLGRTFHYNAQLETYIVGGTAGDILLDGNADFNFPLFGDTVRLDATAFFHLEKPFFYYNHFHSKHLWWDNEELESKKHTHIEGLLNIGRTKTQIRFAADNIDNLSYFASSYKITGDFGRVNNNVEVRQSGNFSLLTVQLTQLFKWKAINLETQLTYQKSYDKVALPVPDLNVYANLFLKFRIAKVLDTELGADVRYFTAYEAPDYSPALGQFCVQDNGENNVKVGNYPIINAYANFHLKSARFFVMYSHANKTAGNYFLTPHYPQNTSLIRFGVSWNFFN